MSLLPRNFVDSLSFRQKAIFLVAVPLLLLLMSTAFAVHLHFKISEAQRWAIHSKNVVARGGILGQLFLAIASDGRGYLLTGNEYFVEQRARRMEQVDRTITSLLESVSDNASQSQLIEAVVIQKQRYWAWSDRVIQLWKVGDPEAMALLRSLEGEGIIRDILVNLDTFLLDEWRLGEERMTLLQKYTFRAQYASIGFFVLGLMTVLVAGWALSESILGRFKILLQRIESFRIDDADESPIPGGDEISRLDQAFRTLRRSLVEKTRENEMFVYSVSHDLRAPLVNLRGFGEELRTSVDDLRKFLSPRPFSDDERAKLDRMFESDIGQSLDFISNSVKRLSSIIDSLLRFSRLSRVLHQPRMTRVGEVVAQVVASLRRTIDERGVTVVVDETLPEVFVDPAVLEQIVANLVENAIKYADPSRPPRIEIAPVSGEAPTDNTLAGFAVKDNGLGLSSEQQSRLFLIFQRFHPDVGSGEGMGLATVRRVVERSGGRITVESQVGEGSRFVIWLPTLPQHATAEQFEAGPYGLPTLEKKP